MNPEAIPSSDNVPRHVAIIMDGNGRWAKRRKLPRAAGHRAGVESVRTIVKACGKKGIDVLTLFAFSSENWRRPKQEVGLLMELFISVLGDEAESLRERNVQLRVVGDRAAFPERLQRAIAEAEQLTKDNDGLTLVIAANYGGRWDITEATRMISRKVAAGQLTAEEISPELIGQHLSLADLPEPDLFIRTGGEKRVSNFLLWQTAYTELYFTDCLWPDFDSDCFDAALASFAKRERRFGRTGEQVELRRA